MKERAMPTFRWYSIQATLQRIQNLSHQANSHRLMHNAYASTSAAINDAMNKSDIKPPALINKHLELLRTLQTCPGSVKAPRQVLYEDYKLGKSKDYSLDVHRLITTKSPEKAINAIKRIVFSSSVSPKLRPRILAAASHSFLRNGNFSRALSMYKLLTSMRYAPPVSLMAAIYRASKQQDTSSSTKSNLSDLSLLLSGSVDIYSLTLLLSTLERSRQPDLMENIIQDYAAQVSSSCLTNASVVTSMIRGYCAAKQLDGCHSWFYRFRSDLPAGDKFIPATPYLCLMTACRKLDPTNTKALYRISKMMQEDGIPFVIDAYNELLLSELQNRNFTGVFKLYSTLQDSQTTTCPDAYTFSLLFDAFWKNETGPRYECSLHPNDILNRMVQASKSNEISLTVFNINSALRYFVHVGDFHSAISTVDIALLKYISPNSLTIRWSLEELLKRCQRAFEPTASSELESWGRVLLGGLTRDHYAHTSHFLDIVRSTRTSHEARKLTRSIQDALRVIHTFLLSGRSAASFASEEQLERNIFLSKLRDILRVCANPAYGIS